MRHVGGYTAGDRIFAHTIFSALAKSANLANCVVCRGFQRIFYCEPFAKSANCSVPYS